MPEAEIRQLCASDINSENHKPQATQCLACTDDSMHISCVILVLSLWCKDRIGLLPPPFRVYGSLSTVEILSDYSRPSLHSTLRSEPESTDADGGVDVQAKIVH